MRVLIAEKNRGFRAEFVELITHCHPNWQIVQTADVIEFRTRLATSRFDVAFIDLELPGLHTYLDLGTLRADYPHAKIIGLGDTNDSATIIRCFEDGLGGYISRGCSGINLIRTLRVIATPDLFISTGGNAAACASGSAPMAPPAREPEGTAHALTARQADVLNLLAEGRSTKEIARRLGLAVPTVKSHLAAVYRQLGARNRLQAVVKASALSVSGASVSALIRGMAQPASLERHFAAG